MSDLPHVVCSFCGATNRVPSSGNARSAKCGKCGVALFSGVPADVPAAILEKQIAKSDIPVVVDIWAPQFEAAARQAEPALRFVKLNSDENQEIASRLGIRGIPTMIMFKGGKEVARVSGAMSSSDILKWTRDEA